MAVAPELIERFRADLDALVAPELPLGVAVSGGPDSLALLLLAAAARPGAVKAATVDHGLRSGSNDEAHAVAAVCARIGVDHSILKPGWAELPTGNIQAQARDARYDVLASWAEERGLGAIASAHHMDDQAETLLMRIARGSGVGGLAAVQPARPLSSRVRLVRPLLTWRRAELRMIVDGAGLKPLDDPSNDDERFDRTRARSLLASVDWLDPARLGQVAANAADAEAALEWMTGRLYTERSARDGEAVTIAVEGIPREMRRRLLMAAIAELGGAEPPGPKLDRALATLDRGGTTTLSGLKLQGGQHWRLSPAPPRIRKA